MMLRHGSATCHPSPATTGCPLVPQALTVLRMGQSGDMGNPRCSIEGTWRADNETGGTYRAVSWKQQGTLQSPAQDLQPLSQGGEECPGHLGRVRAQTDIPLVGLDHPCRQGHIPISPPRAGGPTRLSPENGRTWAVRKPCPQGTFLLLLQGRDQSTKSLVPQHHCDTPPLPPSIHCPPTPPTLPVSAHSPSRESPCSVGKGGPSSAPPPQPRTYPSCRVG